MFLPKLPYSPCTQFIQPTQTLREASRGSAKEACLRLSPSVPEANPFLLFLCNPLGSGSGFPQATSILIVFQPLFPEKSHFFMRPFPNSLGKEWSPLETYPHGAYATHYSWPRNNDNDDDDNNSDIQISFCKQTLDTPTFYSCDFSVEPWLILVGIFMIITLYSCDTGGTEKLGDLPWVIGTRQWYTWDSVWLSSLYSAMKLNTYHLCCAQDACSSAGLMYPFDQSTYAFSCQFWEDRIWPPGEYAMWCLSPAFWEEGV